MRQSLAAMTAALLLAFTACGNDAPEGTPTSELPTETATTEASAEAAVELTVGGPYTLTVADGESEYGYDVTAVEASTVTGEDYTLDVVEFTVEITVHEGELNFVNGWSPWITPTLITGDGTEYEQATYAAQLEFPDSIAAGESATGLVGFEAPASAAESGTYRLELLALEGSTFHDWTY